jgi:hypothetical protein
MWWSVAILAVSALLWTACGGGESTAAADEQISDSGAVHSVESLPSIGFKQSRSYSLEGLPEATAAIYGFWRKPGRDPVDYEVRVYDSHADAIEFGVDLAREGSGDDAVLDDSAARYKAGIKDRRIITGAGSGGGARSGIRPRYANYAVIDNLVVLCQGGAESQSLERCAEFADALRSGAGS